MTGAEIYRTTAPAKVNLFLHIIGRREDGYHLLESLFVFTQKGDELIFRESDRLTFSMSGPFCGMLNSGEGVGDNLVLKAAQLLADKADVSPKISIELRKNLPVAAGIGGGSSDAASTLLALNKIWGLSYSLDVLAELALPLGADVPACLYQRPIIARGIGEEVTLYDYRGPKHILLVNPRVGVSTPAIFKAFHASGQGFDDTLVALDDTNALLKSGHNTLQTSACRLEPAIKDVLTALQEIDDTPPIRMSGSGATCFALFENAEDCAEAASILRLGYPGWWVAEDSIRA